MIYYNITYDGFAISSQSTQDVSRGLRPSPSVRLAWYGSSQDSLGHPAGIRDSEFLSVGRMQERLQWMAVASRKVVQHHANMSSLNLRGFQNTIVSAFHATNATL